MCVWVLPTSTTSSMASEARTARAEAAAGAAHLLPRDPLQSIGRAAPVPGTSSSGCELEQRHEHEPPRRDLAVRQRQPLRGVGRVPEQQHVDVDRARPVLHIAVLAGLRAPEGPLDRLARVEQGLRPKGGLDPQAGVVERALVGHLANRRGLVHRRGHEHDDVVRPQRLDAGLQVQPPVADVRAEPEVADHVLQGTQSKSSAASTLSIIPVAKKSHVASTSISASAATLRTSSW